MGKSTPTWPFMCATRESQPARRTAAVADPRTTRYDSNMTDIMANYHPQVGADLTEYEVFAGIILGKNNGVANKRVREGATAMSDPLQARRGVHHCPHPRRRRGARRRRTTTTSPPPPPADDPLLFDLAPHADEALPRAMGLLLGRPAALGTPSPLSRASNTLLPPSASTSCAASTVLPSCARSAGMSCTLAVWGLQHVRFVPGGLGW